MGMKPTLAFVILLFPLDASGRHLRPQATFVALMLAQAADSVEEYVGHLLVLAVYLAVQVGRSGRCSAAA